MKRIFTILFLILIFSVSTTFAEENKDTPTKTWSENQDVFNKGFENQEAVSDSKFKKMIEQLKERSLTRKQRKIRNEVKPLSPSIDEDHLKTFAQSQDPEDQLSQTLTVTIPVEAFDQTGKKIAPGYYKLSCRKLSENLYVLDLSQGTQRILTVEAKQTQQDLEQETIQFCKAEVIENNRIRLMYGSIDLNLVGYLYF